MTIIVTGATGFLGSHVVRALVGQNRPVVALGRDPERLARLSSPVVRSFAADLSSPMPDDLIRAIGHAESIVHCAALSQPFGRRDRFVAANVGGTAQALKLARATGARRFVNISSPSVLFRFADGIDLDETVPLPTPVNAYAATKAQAERLVLAATDLDIINLRPRGIYGAGDGALLPRLLNAASRGPLPLFSGGRAAIDLTHVDDVVASILAALHAPATATGATYHVSGGVMLPVRTIVESAARRAGINLRWRSLPFAPLLAAARLIETAHLAFRPDREPPVTPYALGLFAFRQSLAITKARDRLGWQPAVSFDDGLERTFAPVVPS